MPVQIIDGDLFQTHAKYICHQVNCQARMGSGVAKQVRAKYPEVYNAYVGFCNEERNVFGRTQFAQAIQSYQNSREKIALVIDLSAEIQDQRIIDVLDKNCSIYHLSITAPNRDFVTSIGIQDAFVRELRNILERIKNDNPAAECIHIFPAMPNSLAVRMGMDFMPKADLPWVIYEQAGANTGFIETITIGG